MVDTRLSDIREETSVDLVDECDAENARDPEFDRAIKQLFEATKNGWALFRVSCLKIYVMLLIKGGWQRWKSS